MHPTQAQALEALKDSMHEMISASESIGHLLGGANAVRRADDAEAAMWKALDVFAALSSPSSTVMDEKGEREAFDRWFKEEHGDRVPTDNQWQAFRAGLRALTAPAPSAAEPVALGWTSQEIIEAFAAAGMDDRTLRRLMSALKVVDRRTRAPAPPRPEDDALWDKTLKERDDYHEWADRLAERISTITGVDIGEHSSANNPWQNAVNAADEFSYGPTPDKAPTALPCGRASMCSDCSECGGEPQCIPSPEPVVTRDADWTSAEDGLPEHGQLVLCELDDETSESLGINFGFSVETWDEHHTLGGVVRWLPLNRLPETAADQAVLDRLAAPPAPQPTEAETSAVKVPFKRIADVESDEIADMRPGRAYREGWNACREAVIAALKAEAPVAEPVAPPPIDYTALIKACFKLTGFRQGEKGCIAFARGAEWYQSQAMAAPSAAEDAKDGEMLDWLLLRISGFECRRIGIHYSGNVRRSDVAAAMAKGGGE